MLEGISFDWKNIVNKIQVEGKTKANLLVQRKTVNGTNIKWSLTPKFPHCQTVELDEYFPDIQPESVFFYFKRIPNIAVVMHLEDRNIVVDRSLKSSLFDYSGPKIFIDNLIHSTHIQMAFQMVQKIDSELDITKNCSNYPNEKFDSYKECDRKYVYDKMIKRCGLIPFWATDDLDEVTNMR